MEHAGMSRSATPATRNEATQRLKLQNVTTFAPVARGTAIVQSSRMVANGCRRLRTQKQCRAITSPPPDPRNTIDKPSLHIWEKQAQPPQPP